VHFGSQLVEVEYPNLVLGIDMCPLGTSMKPTMHTVTLSTVDLLKIDVERAEVDALRGVEPSDWPQIQQVVMEVHDSNNALQEAMSILTGAGGFDNVVVEQDDALKGTDLYTMYCTRADSAVAGP